MVKMAENAEAAAAGAAAHVRLREAKELLPRQPFLLVF
jgi:hypothetical protein